VKKEDISKSHTDTKKDVARRKKASPRGEKITFSSKSRFASKGMGGGKRKESSGLIAEKETIRIKEAEILHSETPSLGGGDGVARKGKPQKKGKGNFKEGTPTGGEFCPKKKDHKENGRTRKGAESEKRRRRRRNPREISRLGEGGTTRQQKKPEIHQKR